MQGKCVTKENNSYGPKFPSTITFLMVCPPRISLTYAHYVIHDWKKQIPNLDFWCRWSTDLCVKQIDIGVILRAFSQNCKCVSIGVVRSIGEYGSLCLSGLVSARGGSGGKGRRGFRIPSLMTPTVSDSLPALCGSASFSVVLKLIQIASTHPNGSLRGRIQ